VSMMARPGLQHRGLTARRPRAVHERGQKHARFVDKNYRALLLGGLFLSDGQTRSIQF
jgi:hypothetical protein